MTDPAELPLRDIHLPDPVSWWPPAPGWWLLAAVMTVALLAAWLIVMIRRRTRLKRTALQQLDDLKQSYAEHRDPVEMVRALSVLLRRACISFYPRSEAASLTGERWLLFLDATAANTGFLSEQGRALIDGPYARYIDPVHVDVLVQLTERWLRSQGASRYRRGPAA